jgi:serine/threonine-protein kinase
MSRMQAAGTLLAGRYRLEEVIGRGGMSTVYRASDESLGRTVAVKILLATLADQDPTYSARFEREARAAAALTSSAVVTVYDTGLDEGSHYIVMEYVSGRSLDEILRDGQPLEPAEALRIGGRVADALAAAHAAGILHRDIKPANVMLAADGAVKVLDFGIARRLDGTSITQVASVVGTAAYMAPERALGHAGDERADIYSLGCLLFAMLTGRPPFMGEISAAILHQQINAEPPSPSRLRPGIPPELDALVLAMLAKEPEARPANAAELRERIGALEVAGGAATAATRAATAPTAVATAPTAVATARPAVRPGPGPGRAGRQGFLADHRHRAIVMALATAALVLIVVALLSGGGSSRQGTTSSPAGSTTAPPVTTRTTPATTSTPTTSSAPSPTPAPPAPAKPKAKKGHPPGHGGEPPGKAKKGKE